MVSMVRLLVMLFTKILYEYAVHLPQHMVTVSVTTLNPGEMLICGLKKKPQTGWLWLNVSHVFCIPVVENVSTGSYDYKLVEIIETAVFFNRRNQTG